MTSFFSPPPVAPVQPLPKPPIFDDPTVPKPYVFGSPGMPATNTGSGAKASIPINVTGFAANSSPSGGLSAPSSFMSPGAGFKESDVLETILRRLGY